MLKGIAQSGNGDPQDDRYAVVLELAQLTKAISEAKGDSAYATAAELGATLLRVPRAAVFVKGRDGKLTTGSSVGIDGNRSLMSAAHKIAETAIGTARPVLFPNVAAQATELGRDLTKAGVVSVLCVPMRVGESNVGAIVAMASELRAFSPSDIELLHVVASQAALAVWQSGYSPSAEDISRESSDDLVKLAQRKIHELSLINHFSEAINSTLYLDKLLDIALEQSTLAIGADGGSLMLLNEDTNRLEIVASRGIARKWVENTSQQIGMSIAGWVAEHGESVLVTNAHEDERFQMKEFRDAISSAASVPLKTKSGIIGVLNVNTTKLNKMFDERDLELLGTVANQMAAAIENARLYARVNRRTQQLDSLLQISKTVTSTLNLDEVMHRMAGEISQLFQLDVCVLLLLDDHSGRFRFGYGSGLRTRRKTKYYDLASPLAAQVKATSKKILLRGINSSALASEVSKAEGLKAAMCLPLRNSGKLVGVAVGFARDARTFPKSQRDIMKPLGELAGVAISNARIYRQKYRIAEMLRQRLAPSSVPEIDGLQIGHKCLPAREVGGDYYDFLTVAPGRIGIAVGDVSGNDVEAAEYTTMGKHVLRAYARECISPAQVLMKTNNLVCDDTAAELFISLFYGVMDLEGRKLIYANAGCEPPILYKARDKSIGTLPADGILLGIRPEMIYEEREVSLEPGDIVVIYTDGVTEAGLDRDRFGREALMEIVSANANMTAQEIADCVHDALIEFAHGRVTDDTTMVVLKLS